MQLQDGSLLVLAPNHLANASLPLALLMFGDPPELAAGLLCTSALLAQALHHLLLCHLHEPLCCCCTTQAATQSQPNILHLAIDLCILTDTCCHLLLMVTKLTLRATSAYDIDLSQALWDVGL